VLRVKRVFNNGLFGDSVIGGIGYMLFKSGFKGSTSLTYVIFPTRARNLVNSWAKHRVGFIFSNSKSCFRVL
jgi:hypothetical protein